MNSEEVFFEEIDLKIAQTLQEAKTEILVAVAWFTDAKLFKILLEKVRLGLRVEVIVADKEENHRLPSEVLIEAGGDVYLIKGGSFGMMHHLQINDPSCCNLSNHVEHITCYSKSS